MKTLPRATRLTALLSGLALGAGVSLVPSVQAYLELSERMKGASVMLVILFLFFGPVLLFVVGVPHLSVDWPSQQRSAYWASLRQIGLRALIWLGGCGISVAALAHFGPHLVVGQARVAVVTRLAQTQELNPGQANPCSEPPSPHS
ncbi:MAG: hypothetical protein OEU93_05260 [Rubrivivax sp.]|nr:hypothetical protein [Rubrivivax sp.]